MRPGPRRPRARAARRPRAGGRGRPRPSTARGVELAAAAIAAAVPAAWPIAMHVAIDRADACASWVAEKQRPATAGRRCRAGSRHRYGIPYTPPLAHVLPGGVAARAVVLDRRAAQRDLVVEAARRRGRRRGSAGSRRGRAGSRARRSTGDVATITDRSKPGTRSRRKRWYSCTWRRPSTSARVSCAGIGRVDVGDAGHVDQDDARRTASGATSPRPAAAGSRRARRPRASAPTAPPWAPPTRARRPRWRA